jgi:hypothetical protein
MFEKLSDLSQLHSTGAFGDHLTAVVVMIFVSTFIYAGPAIAILFYQLFKDRKKPAVIQMNDSSSPKSILHKAA